MATVFLARAEGLGGFEREVAVKLLHDHLRENAELASQLVNEARISAKIRHPNVVQVHDVGEDPTGIFLVMEYVEGDTLSGLQRAARAAGEAVPVGIALRILTDALAGLHSAHELHDDAGQPMEIVHRDFSPQNILVGTDGISRLTDFGIAKAATGLGGHTRPGLIKGKIGYMAPEQARGRSVDRRCDVWAAGVVAWELLAGRPLRGNEDEVATLLEVVSGDPPDIRTVCPGISDALADAVTSALTGPRDRRCPTAAELRQRLVHAWRAQGEFLADNGEVAAYVRRFGRGLEAPKVPRRWTQKVESIRAEKVRLDLGGPSAPPNTATLPSLALPAIATGATGSLIASGTLAAGTGPNRAARLNRRASLLLAGAMVTGALLIVSGLVNPLPSQTDVAQPAVSIYPAPRPTTAPSVAAAPGVTPAGTQALPPPSDVIASVKGDREQRTNVDGRTGLSRAASLRHNRLDARLSRAKMSSRTRFVGRATPAAAPATPAGKSPPPLAGNPYAGPSD